jgi:hypothetical protein
MVFSKPSNPKKFPSKKMPEKADFKDYDNILNNFDKFCDEFESRASEAFNRGDQNDGRVTTATAEIGDSTPPAVREVDEPGPTDIAIGAPAIDV